MQQGPAGLVVPGPGGPPVEFERSVCGVAEGADLVEDCFAVIEHRDGGLEIGRLVAWKH